MKTNTKYIIPVISFFILTQFLNSCSLSKQNDIACPDFKSKRQQTDISLKNPDFFRFLKSDRSKQANSKKDEFDANKGIKEKEIRDKYPSDYLSSKSFEVIAEKFVLSEHLQKGGQQVKAHNLKKTMKEKSRNKSKLSDIHSDKPCDTIILKSGVKIPATDIKIESKNVRFKTCANENIQGKQIVKELVNKIKYHNGTEKIFESKKSEKSGDLNGNKKQEIFGILALLILFTGFVPLSLILAIISLIRIKKNPGKFKGEKLARLVIVAAIIVGIVAALLFLLLLKSFHFKIG